MALERNGVQASLASLALARGDRDRAERLLAEADPAITYYRERWALVRAESLVIAGATDAADTLLRALPDQSLSLQSRIAVATLRSRILLASGHTDLAVDAVEGLRLELERTAERLGSPVLRYLLARRLEQIDEAALHARLQPGASDAPLDAAWTMVRRRAARMDLAPHGERRPVAAAEALDREIAADLLLGQALASSGTVLELLAQGERAPLPAALPESPALFAATLPQGTWVLSHMDAGDSGVMLWLSRDRQHATTTLPRHALQALQAELDTALASATTPLAEIERRAWRLRDALFAGLPASGAPTQIVIDRDSALASIPWSVLAWPGQPGPLAETTVIRRAPLQRRDTVPPALDGIDIAVADRAVATEATSMDTLSAAAGETRAIQAAARTHGVAVTPFDAATRTQVLASLRAPGRALHVAAHGLGDAGRIGGSGLWLAAASPGGDPAFLGWTEPLTGGVDARLVVLSACSLAARGDTAQASMGFAAALSRGGAADVVAALWPTSDAATTVWVPGFYDALLREPGNDPALALSAAVASLRRSRMFRHPFYWASLVHLSDGI